MTPLQFVDKWRPVALTERAAAQEHFIDLCRLFDHPTPIEDDPMGERFTFEKGVHRAGGGEGFADVWKRGFFAWEYKKRKRNLDEALGQLSRYALALENPPLQIVCDTERFRIVTAYTNCAPRSYDLSLEDLLDHKKRAWLEYVFYNPTKLQPGASRADLTKEAADRFSTLTARLQSKGFSVNEVGHFVNQLVFLFFAEDVGILKGGFFRRTITELTGRSSEAKPLLTSLFRTLKTGGRFGLDRLPWINGGMFDDREALPLDDHEIALIKAASSQDWAHVDPTIFGTLFERFLDPGKRSQIGAHYTDTKKIEQIITPVIVEPLKQEWRQAYAEIAAFVAKAKVRGHNSKEWQKAEERQSQFLERLRTLSILDPACGSGNFLYLALQAVKNLEFTANQECEALGLQLRMPLVGPEILKGIEINPLAAELARTTIWIGDIQWSIRNGVNSRPEPILRSLQMIECRDALLKEGPALAGVGAARLPLQVAATWPEAEFIVGNPPFLGGKLLRRRLGDNVVEDLFRAYEDRVPAEADLVTYWFEKASDHIKSHGAKRVGLVATNSIRGGANRIVIENILKSNVITEAWSDEPWVVDGAQVRVSLICFSAKSLTNSATLNGEKVSFIRSDLTADVTDLTQAQPLLENQGIAFSGISKKGSFDITGQQARKFLKAPSNPNGRKNADVIQHWINGLDLTRRPQDMFLINFGERSEEEAMFYELPFAWIKKNVHPQREVSRSDMERREWWRLARRAPALQAALKPLKRYLATPEVSKHRFFVWVDSRTIADKNVVAIARDDDFTFGVLSSSFHTSWSLRLGTSLEDRPRYTSTTTFRSFPFPRDMSKQVYARVSRIAESLDGFRRKWLNPPEWVDLKKDVTSTLPDRISAKSAEFEVELQSRTMTKLYNNPPAWLTKAHRELDLAVAAAYGWPEDISTEDALARLLGLNRDRAATQGKA